MNAQHNSVAFRNLGPFLPNSLSSIFKITCLISFKTCFDQYSSFDFPTLSFNIFFQVTPIFSRGLVVGQIHSVCILSQLLLDLIYSLPNSNRPLRHPVGWLHSVCFSVRLWINSTVSLPIFIWQRIHPVTLQMLKLHPKIIPHQNSPVRYFLCL